MLFNTKNKMDTINRQAAIIRLYYVLLCHPFRKASYRGHIAREGIEANFEHLKISRTLALTFISSCLGAHPDRPPSGVCLWGQMDAVVAGAVPARSGTGACWPPVSRTDARVGRCKRGQEAWKSPQPNTMLVSRYGLGKPLDLAIPGALRRSLNDLTTEPEVRTSEELGKAGTQRREEEKELAADPNLIQSLFSQGGETVRHLQAQPQLPAKRRPGTRAINACHEACPRHRPLVPLRLCKDAVQMKPHC